MRPFSIFAYLLFLACNSAFAANNPVELTLTGQGTFRFAGYYVALAKGFYLDEKIDTKINQSKQSRSEVMDEVLSNKNRFALGNSSLALASMEGKAITVVADIFQRSTGVIITQPSFGNQIFNMQADKILLEPAKDNPEVYALLTSQGVAYKDVTQANPAVNYLNEFIAGRALAVSGSLNTAPRVLTDKKIPFVVIDPVNYGVNFYGDTIFTSAELAQANPDLIARFNRATIKGWQYALAHPEDAQQYLDKAQLPKQDVAAMQAEVELVRQLVLPSIIPLGQINPERWQAVANFYSQVGLAKPNTNLGDHFLFHVQQKEANRFFGNFFEVVSLVVFIIFALVLTVTYRKNRYLNSLVSEKDRLVIEAESKANQDPLTGLPNRRLLIDSLRKAVVRADQQNSQFAVCFIDINGFKPINDRYGHVVGDDILVQLASRIVDWLQADDILARQGGDEFVLIMDESNSVQHVTDRIEQMRGVIGAPLSSYGTQFEIVVSVGFAIYKMDANNTDELMKIADRNMYREKFRIVSE